MKKIPMRRCVATQESLPKKELIRVVRTPEGAVKIDLTGKLNGRGAYLKRSIDAIKIAKTKGVLSRALECQVDDSIFDELTKLCNE